MELRETGFVEMDTAAHDDEELVEQFMALRQRQMKAFVYLITFVAKAKAQQLHHLEVPPCVDR